MRGRFLQVAQGGGEHGVIAALAGMPLSTVGFLLNGSSGLAGAEKGGWLFPPDGYSWTLGRISILEEYDGGHRSALVSVHPHVLLRGFLCPVKHCGDVRSDQSGVRVVIGRFSMALHHGEYGGELPCRCGEILLDFE